MPQNINWSLKFWTEDSLLINKNSKKLVWIKKANLDIIYNHASVHPHLCNIQTKNQMTILLIISTFLFTIIGLTTGQN